MQETFLLIRRLNYGNAITLRSVYGQGHPSYGSERERRARYSLPPRLSHRARCSSLCPHYLQAPATQARPSLKKLTNTQNKLKGFLTIFTIQVLPFLEFFESITQTSDNNALDKEHNTNCDERGNEN